MHPRYYEGVVYLHPEADWTLSPHDRPLVLQDDGAGSYVRHWGLAGEPPTDAEITAALAEKDGAADAEVLRVATYADDPEVTDGLTAIKGGTAPEIDDYVASVITLTATDIDALREEVQTALRAILRRQFKVLFNPVQLLGQLNEAASSAVEIRKRNGK